MDGFLNVEEVTEVIKAGFGDEKANDEAARSYIERYDSRDSMLTRDGFVQLVSDLSEEKIHELLKCVE